MKLKALKSRKDGTCHVSGCKTTTVCTAHGPSFFSKMSGDIELCAAHEMEAGEMAHSAGGELVHEPYTPAAESTSIVIASGALQSEMTTEATEAENALGEFQAFDILTRDDLTFAAEMLAEVKGNYKRLDIKRKEITKPLNDALKATRALFKPALDFYSECEAALKAKMGEAKQRADAEQRAALAEAQEAAAEGDGEGVADAITSMEEAANFPDADGIQYRSKWRFEITDAQAVPREYCTPDLKLIGGVVTHRKGATEIPGVRVYEDTIIASGST